MITRSAGRRGNEPPEKAWASWVRTHKEILEKATGPQHVLLEATVRFVAVIGGQSILSRAAAFFLLHTGMGLTPAQVGAAIGRTDRAMRTVQALSAQGFLASVWGELGRHRQPKLHAEHAGPIAKYLVDHPDCTQAEMVTFIARELKIHVEPLTLRRFFKAYGLGVLRSTPRHAEPTDTDHPFV
jgi:transposase